MGASDAKPAAPNVSGFVEEISGRPVARMLDHIRQRGEYLTPDPRLGLISLTAMVLRSALFPIVLYFSLLTTYFLFGIYLSNLFDFSSQVLLPIAQAVLSYRFLSLLYDFFSIIDRWSAELESPIQNLVATCAIFLALLVLLFLAVCAFSMIVLIYYSQWLEKLRQRFSKASALFMPLEWAVHIVLKFAPERLRTYTHGSALGWTEVWFSSRLQRFLQRVLGGILSWILLLIGLVLVLLCAARLMDVYEYLSNFEPPWRVPEAGGAALGGLLVAAIAVVLGGRAIAVRDSSARQGFLVFGSLLFLAAFCILAAFAAIEAFVYLNKLSISAIEVPFVESSFVAVSIVAIVIAAHVLVNLCDINFASLHGMYRDRLAETFLPDPPHGVGRRPDASPFLAGLGRGKEDGAPYHLINANVVLTTDEAAVARNRGGDSFVFSPEFCGSQATGWHATHGRLRLDTAMAISGAAASPYTGSAGRGLGRNPIVGMAMALCNVRLGYAFVNRSASALAKLIVPNFWRPGGSWLFGKGYDRKSWFLEITDGGHFDNTGVYELVRRKVRLIVVCDCGADPNYVFADMSNLIQRARVDFGANIDFTDHGVRGVDSFPLEDLSPSQSRPATCLAIARIRFAGEEKFIDPTSEPEKIDDVRWLIVVKPRLFADLPSDVQSYAARNPKFPQQSTANQFFSEEQFEAYRELGYRQIVRAWTDANISSHPALRALFGKGPARPSRTL